MTTIIRTDRAQDFLALVPHLTGFQPRQSIVLVAFRGNRTCGALRCDLPEPSAPAAVRRRAATTMIGMVCRIPGVDAVVPVVYTDDAFSAGVRMPHRAFIRTVLSRATDSGFLVRDALCVATDGWGSYLDDGCPQRGRPLDLIAASPAGRTLATSAERSALIDIDTEATLPAADFETRERTAKTYTALESLRESPELAPALVFDHGFPGDVVGFADTLIRGGGEVVSPQDAALLAFLVQGPCTRDEILLTWAWGQAFGDSVGRMNDRHHSGEDISGMPGAMALGGFDMPRPDPDRIRSGIGVLRYTAARVPRRAQPPLLTMIGWSHWALGAGTLAGRWTDQARVIDSDYGLAELLDTMLQGGRLPDWAWEVPPDATNGVAIGGGR